MQFSSVLGLTSLHKCHVNTKAEITTHSFEVLNGIFLQLDKTEVCINVWGTVSCTIYHENPTFREA